jgi:hypothetical protein
MLILSKEEIDSLLTESWLFNLHDREVAGCFILTSVQGWCRPKRKRISWRSLS